MSKQGENQEREVRFDLYCKKCQYQDSPQNEDPCDSCLGEPYNYDTDRPVKYVKSTKKVKKK